MGFQLLFAEVLEAAGADRDRPVAEYIAEEFLQEAHRCSRISVGQVGSRGGGSGRGRNSGGSSQTVGHASRCMQVFVLPGWSLSSIFYGTGGTSVSRGTIAPVGPPQAGRRKGGLAQTERGRPQRRSKLLYHPKNQRAERISVRRNPDAGPLVITGLKVLVMVEVEVALQEPEAFRVGQLKGVDQKPGFRVDQRAPIISPVPSAINSPSESWISGRKSSIGL